ncbi:major facilitator superfamily MFS_1 [Beutenbergia cavernae DSM 12333]|uniref:Major facilitator superfamily MFS_1 n=1 Tax=Beutenbergia cavernae (strain ATCC BAA-8 / DSM 12333 / CCUG 43141 / JCM 11478 / NBRC 16432 / NCIMB 13614 / HKI 0122) TaxID=471853 RepID=C5BY03_BEUC1|nr:MFS transporter [Beutenbergia cavernae]ACQ78897.1 major facilitator superfamily MFS_1 [Beutenbergia cavernae DSM 12333]
MSHDDALPAPTEHLPAAPGAAGAPAPRRQVVAWGFWDWGQQAFQTIILTFVFSVYLTTAVAEQVNDSDTRGTQALSNAQTIAGVAIALLCPLMGVLADRYGRRRRLLAIATLALVACMVAMFFVRPDQQYLVLGVTLVALASVFSEIAGVFYNGMLLQIATPTTFGRVSGMAWGLGYLGGLVSLVICLFAFVLPDVGLFGVTTDDGLAIRAVALFSAVWCLVFCLPLLVLGPDTPAGEGSRGSLNPVTAYRDIGLRIAHMWRNERGLLHFLVASAVYRDGLGAVFAFAGVLAASAYGFSTTEVIYLGIAANLGAGVGTWIAGRIDDAVGPRRLIVTSLTAIVVLGAVVATSPSPVVFWVCGIGISLFVGPVQSASRSLLARITPFGHENENFGLYATAGRAVSFLAPAAFALAIALFGFNRAGIIGIVAVLLIGLLLFLPLRVPANVHLASTDAPR